MFREVDSPRNARTRGVPTAALAGALDAEVVSGVELNGMRRDLLEEVRKDEAVSNDRSGEGEGTHGRRKWKKEENGGDGRTLASRTASACNGYGSG